ncbi:MAG: hypothetical protein Q8R32_03705 [bacterium]|nr:hypothetical protein [bacterium]
MENLFDPTGPVDAAAQSFANTTAGRVDTVAVLYNPRDPASQATAERFSGSLRDQGIAAQTTPGDQFSKFMRRGEPVGVRFPDGEELVPTPDDLASPGRSRGPLQDKLDALRGSAKPPPGPGTPPGGPKPPPGPGAPPPGAGKGPGSGGAGGPLVTCDLCTIQDLVGLGIKIFNWLLAIGGAAALLALIVGGTKYITAVFGAEGRDVAGAKQSLLFAIIGLVVLLMAYAIVNTVYRVVFKGTIDVPGL